jgi:hypothetical protein
MPHATEQRVYHRLLPLNGYDQTRALAFYDRLLTRISSLPGIRTVSLTNTPLLAGANWLFGIRIAVSPIDLLREGIPPAMSRP